jgi:NAD(P)-dependent dehydrogenase (short-subunit alcohol dehydrogenase family)
VQSFKTIPVLVTGAGRGIGKRLAMGFATQGARVGLLARSKPELDLCNLEIEHAGGNALRIRADVADYEQVAASVERMRVQFGSAPQVLVCAAGTLGHPGPFADSSTKSWNEIIQTNLIGVMNACRAVLPDMVQHRKGKIIILTGGQGSQARPNFALYAATKAAIVSFVESVAEELRDHNVQINCMSPGASYTHMTDQILSAGDRAGWKEVEDAQHVRLTGGIPADKQIELALFLGSEASNHISGRLIHVLDDWKRLRESTVKPELYTLRRVQKI